MEKNCKNCTKDKCPVYGFVGTQERFYCSRHLFKKEKKIYKEEVWVYINTLDNRIRSFTIDNGVIVTLHSHLKLIKKIPIEYEEPTNL